MYRVESTDSNHVYTFYAKRNSVERELYAYWLLYHNNIKPEEMLDIYTEPITTNRKVFVNLQQKGVASRERKKGTTSTTQARKRKVNNNKFFNFKGT